MDKKIELAFEEKIIDETGRVATTPQSFQAFAIEKSITRDEFYKSYNLKIEPKLILEIRQEDFEKTKRIIDGKIEYANKVIFENCTYEIVRTYKIGRSKIEVVLR